MTDQDSKYERRHLSVLFDDMVGSTQMLNKIGDSDFVPLLRRHNHALADILARLGDGQCVKSTGDGSLVIFENSKHAVLCALSLQEYIRSGKAGFSLRIGIDAGPVKFYRKGPIIDVFGMTVAKASRITGLSLGNHILASKALYDEAAPHLDLAWLKWHRHGFNKPREGEPATELYEPYDSRIATPMAHFNEKK